MTENPWDQLSRMILEDLPQSLRGLRSDLADHIRHTVENKCQQLSLATRDDIEILKASLRKTQQRVAALEDKLAQRD